MRRLCTSWPAFLSLLLCVAVCGLWARSYWSADAVTWAGSSVDWTVRSNRSRLAFSRVLHETVGSAPERSPLHVSCEAAYTPSDDAFAGFSHQHITYDVGIFADIEKLDVGVPHWFMAILLAIAPAMRLRAAAQHCRRDRTGRCPACGYDLRATPDRCPECGRGAEPDSAPSIPVASR
jgi:hypothetical protein